jgi:hypothetical protein
VFVRVHCEDSAVRCLAMGLDTLRGWSCSSGVVVDGRFPMQPSLRDKWSEWILFSVPAYRPVGFGASHKKPWGWNETVSQLRNTFNVYKSGPYHIMETEDVTEHDL